MDLNLKESFIETPYNEDRFLGEFTEENLINYSRSSNYRIYLPILKNIVNYAQTISMPGFSFSLPEYGGFTGSKIYNAPDSVSYDSLTINLLLDEKYDIYKQLLNFIRQSVHPNNGTFKNISFTMAVEVVDNKGYDTFKVFFEGCRVESIGGFDFSSNSEDVEQTLSLTIKFDDFYIPEKLEKTMFYVKEA